NDEQTRKILTEYKKTLSPEQINGLTEENIRLQEWQSTPDSAEDIAKIPFISLTDIKREVEQLPIESATHDLITLLKHPIATNGIVYLSAYFDMNHLPDDDLPWVSLFSDLLGNLDTEHYTFSELANEIDIHTGGVSTEFNFYTDTIKPDNILPKFNMRSKCILDKTEKMLELAAEYTFKNKFTDIPRITQLIKETKARTQMMIINAGHLIAIRRMLAQNSRLHKWQDMTQGMDYYNFLNKLEAKIASDPQEVTDKLIALANALFNKNKLILSITSQEDDIKQVWQKISLLTSHIKTADNQSFENTFKPNTNNEGIIAPVNVQYCAQGGSFSQSGHEYSGKMMVLTNILRNDFLMQELRVKGGAYGILVQFSRQGNMFFCSYRDPNLVNTFEVYGKTSEYVQNFECTPRDFEKYIIGTMAELDMPYSPYQKGINSDSHFITGFTFEDRQQLRDEVLSTKIEDIRNYARLIDYVMKKHQIAVFGVETTLKENSNLFDVLIPAIPN
ncbi:MAG: peptidase M16, partial [Bacteroidia bacterium]